MYNETKVLPKMEDFASLLGDAAYCQWQKGLLKQSLKICYFARGILAEVADVLNVICAIYIESGAARIDEGTMVMEQVLQLCQNCLKQRKETDEDYQDDYTRVLNILSNPACCWIGKRDLKKRVKPQISKSNAMFKRYPTKESPPVQLSRAFCKCWPGGSRSRQVG